MTSNLELDRVAKHYGDVAALHDVSVTIPEGEFFSFLGPSGCGKTTVLRLISGFIDPSAGDIRLGGRTLAGIAPHRRPTALIFQNLALFPLMSVADNVAFGLTVRGVPLAERRRRAAEMLEFVALGGFGDRRIEELSGGQRQRVAIARALAVEPAVLLLDEPLSALDLKLRQHMRGELRAMQRRSGVTFIYITHDQGEALAMSDRVAVMSEGRIEQIGSSEDVYNRPATAFVASFVGENNMLRGLVEAADASGAVVATPFGPLRGGNPAGLRTGDDAMLFVRPERLRPAAIDADAQTVIESRVTSQVFEGSVVNVTLERPGGRDIVVTLSNDGSAQKLSPGDRRRFAFDAREAIVLPAATLAHG
jgi:spermidine/putrescine transport system ATP-binding protein